MKALKNVKVALTMIGLLAVLMAGSEALAAKQPPAAPVELNSATVEQLSTIPGLGASKAKAIVDYRTATPFGSAEDLVNVKGIGDKLFAKIAPFVTVSGKAPQQKTGTAVKATN